MYPEICIVEDHTIKGHAVGRLLNASKLQKSIILALKLNTLPTQEGWGRVHLKTCYIRNMTLSAGEQDVSSYSVQKSRSCCFDGLQFTAGTEC